MHRNSPTSDAPRLREQADNSASAVTLVLNPNARRMKLRSLSPESFKALLPPTSDVCLTQNLGELDLLMSNWKNGEQTLCFYGGDGSISQGITSLIRHHGEDFNLPPVLPVRAGTINFLCNTMGNRETADRTLQRWFKNELTTVRTVPTLKVEVEGEPARYGFVLAWGVGFRVLSEYYRRNATPNVMDAAAVMTQTFTQAIRPNSADFPLFRRENLRLSTNDGPAKDAKFHTLTVGTIPRLSLGIRPFPPGEILPGSFSFSANGMPLSRVANYSPTLLFGMGDQKLLDFGDELVSDTGVRSLSCELSEGFTMDGEVFVFEGYRHVKISAGPAVRFWTGQKKFFPSLPAFLKPSVT